ncbi:bacteriophage holin [Legionella tucsonensis]|uniref:Transmembrane protein n=1 Tax=Legionella tucsonensis TaxID=40335 RepID=A0A0W0ZUZ1_9GAMM|nr:bacteriophage holin [Legionella tucsonensis]KTD72758.1 hypothetical protein Ltuc_0605 [Legionella tucsonensis]
MKGCKLSPVALGLALGVFWGITVFIMGLIAHYYAYGQAFVATMGTIYPGYEPSLMGSFLGGIIGFIDAFITGFLIAWLYNLFSCCKCVCCDKKKDEGVIKEKVIKEKPIKKNKEVK